MELSFGQNDSPMEKSFWPKDSFITHILFELCLFKHLAQCTLFMFTLYSEKVKKFEDFTKFCGLHRIYELYHIKLVYGLSTHTTYTIENLARSKVGKKEQYRIVISLVSLMSTKMASKQD